MIEIYKISTEEAIKQSEKVLKEKGWDIEKYVAIMEDYRDKWVIKYEGKVPRPPGDEMEIHISKKDGSFKVFMGE